MEDAVQHRIDSIHIGLQEIEKNISKVDSLSLYNEVADILKDADDAVWSMADLIEDEIKGEGE